MSLFKKLMQIFGGPKASVDPQGAENKSKSSDGPESMPPPQIGREDRNQETRQVVIGLDFGTSSTKVAFRLVNSSVAYVFRNPASVGDMWFAVPTSVQERDDSIRFGPDPANGDREYLKLELLEAADGGKEWGELENSAAAYLSCLLEKVGDAVCKEYGVTSFRAVLNIGAPIQYHSSNPRAQKIIARFHEVACAAWAATTWSGGDAVDEGDSREEVIRKISGARTRREEVQDLVHVLPESVAPIVSYDKDPKSREGIFFIVDIGAGTTEMSVGHLVRFQGKTNVLCHAVSSVPPGSARYEQNLAAGVELNARELLRGWWRQWESTWDHGRRKDAHNQALRRLWESTEVFYTGGGALHKDVRSYLESQERPANLKFSFYSPGKEVLRAAGGYRGSRERFHMLAVAHGLAHHRREWPNWFHPEDVKTQRPDQPDDLPYTARGWV